MDAQNLITNPKADRIQLEFRTYASDGLILATGLDMDYLGIWLRDGYIVMSFDLGSGPAEKTSKKQYNDGKWHTMWAMRSKKTGYLKVDDDSPGITYVLILACCKLSLILNFYQKNWTK